MQCPGACSTDLYSLDTADVLVLLPKRNTRLEASSTVPHRHRVLSKTRFSALLAGTRKKARIAERTFFVDGWRWLRESLELSGPPLCVLAVADAARTDDEAAILERAKKAATEYYEATPEQLAKLTGAVTPPGVAALVRWNPAAPAEIAARAPAEDPALVVALDAIGDPGNAGTILRTADWFGAAGVVLGPGSVEPTNPKTLRATMGSIFHLPIAPVESLPAALAALKGAGFAAVGAALDGEPLAKFAWPRRAVIVVGNEASGIGPEVRAALDARVRIPGYGHAESLNAAIAAGILMADWRARAGGGV